MPEGTQEFLAAVLHDAPQPVWVVDHAGGILFSNPAAIAALGYDGAEELLGKPSHNTVHYKHLDGSPYAAEDCPMLVPREHGNSVHGDEEWFVRRDGSMFPIAWWSAPIDLPSGRGAVLAFTDITERHATEEARRERDAAEIREAEARAAQRRILETTFEVRRQLVRDLHDGAQQRLVGLLIQLRLAAETLPPELVEQRELLDAAALDAQAAIGDLRELAAGVHPAILTARGLGAAVQALAVRSPVPVEVDDELSERMPPVLESSAYFLVAELLTNAAKHAHASRVTVALAQGDRSLHVEVRDDGIGGASADAGGTGVLGLFDRVAAVGGTLVLVSPRGEGTTVRAEFPL